MDSSPLSAGTAELWLTEGNDTLDLELLVGLFFNFEGAIDPDFPLPVDIATVLIEVPLLERGCSAVLMADLTLDEGFWVVCLAYLSNN